MIGRFWVALAALALCWTSAATAQTRSDCPVASDMESGIRLTRQSPLFDMVVRKNGATVIEDRTSIENGRKRRIKTTYLYGIVPLSRHEGRGRIDLKVINPKTGFVSGNKIRNWSSPIEIRIIKELYGRGDVSVRNTGNATWTGHGCKYKVKRIIVSTRIEGQETSHFEYYFAPELGVSLGGYKLGANARTRVTSVLPERISRQ